MESEGATIIRLDREKQEFLAILKEAKRLYDNGELCKGDCIRAEWMDQVEQAIAKATASESGVAWSTWWRS